MVRFPDFKKALGGVLLVLLGSGPVLDCQCDDGPRISPTQLLVEPTVLQFDDVAVGYPQTRLLTITNGGGIGLVFSKLAVRQAGGPFSLLGMLNTDGSIGELPASVGIGHSIQVVVQYDPATDDAADFDTLDIQSNDPDVCPSPENQCEIQLSGTGAPPDAELDVVCQQDDICPLGDTPVCRVILDATNTHPVRVALNFCEVPAHRARQLDVLLQNVGNIPLDMDGFELNAGSSEYYDLLAPAQSIVSLDPGQDVMLSLNFAPQARGAAQGGLDVMTNDDDLVYAGQADGTFSVRLLGLSAEPDIDVTPTNIPFEGVDQGGQASEVIHINNTGDAYLIIDGLEVTGGSVAGEFSISPDQGFDIDPAGSADVTVTYAPKDVGADDGSVIIHSNDPDESQVVVTLGGAVRPDLEVTPESTVQFVDVEPGMSAAQDVTLRNVGQADLSIGALALTTNPGDPPVFSLEGLPPTFPAEPIVLAPGASSTFQVRFTDNTMIVDELGQLDIAHNSPNDVNPYPLLLASTGTPANMPPVAVIDPPSLVVNGLAPITLDGSGSYDPDPGGSVTDYNWSFLFLPQDAQGNQSQAELETYNEPTTTFTPDMVGTYIVRLQVYDDQNAVSLPVDAEISVNP